MERTAEAGAGAPVGTEEEMRAARKGRTEARAMAEAAGVGTAEERTVAD